MANLIKGALIKQISKYGVTQVVCFKCNKIADRCDGHLFFSPRYLKNVTPNQINISTLKGEGEMKNIQLDENVLMDLLELPTWLKITNAKCNKANVKVSESLMRAAIY